MKQYYITSMYSQGTQVAIQQDHALKEMLKNIENSDSDNDKTLFNEYNLNHQTTISLGVGQPLELLSLYSFIYEHQKKLNIPFGLFQEPSMNYTPTCLTFVTNEKLSVNLSFVINSLFKDLKINSLYDLKKGFSYVFECPTSKTIVKILWTEDNEFSFVFCFCKSSLPFFNEENVISSKLDDKILKKLYKTLNKKDFLYYNENVDCDSDKKEETILYSYNMEELNFLIKINSLRLK